LTVAHREHDGSGTPALLARGTYRQTRPSTVDNGVIKDWRIAVSGNFVGRSASAHTHVPSLARQPARKPAAVY
jgi:hypothetical protein